MHTVYELVGAQFDGGASVRGAARGPTALRAARICERLCALGFEVHPGSDVAPPEVSEDDPHHEIRHYGEALDFMPRLFDHLLGVYGAGRIPIILGGDHSISIASVAAAKAHLQRIQGERAHLGLLWVDAHADLNTPAASASKNLHGMPQAVLLGYGPTPLATIGGFSRKVRPQDMAIVGLRDADPPERDIIRQEGITALTMTEIDHRGIGAAVDRAVAQVTRETAGFFLSFDLDATDPNLAPGVGSPVRGGITFREAHLVMEMCAASHKLLAIEMVELNPNLDEDGTTAELAISLLESAVGKNILG